jgi:hypothetical protein
LRLSLRRFWRGRFFLQHLVLVLLIHSRDQVLGMRKSLFVIPQPGGCAVLLPAFRTWIKVGLDAGDTDRWLPWYLSHFVEVAEVVAETGSGSVSLWTVWYETAVNPWLTWLLLVLLGTC